MEGGGGGKHPPVLQRDKKRIPHNCNQVSDLAELVFRGILELFQVSSHILLLNTLKNCYKVTYGTINSENLEYSLTNSLLW